MAYHRVQFSFLMTLSAGFMIVCGTTACGRKVDVAQETQVRQVFDSCKQGLINNQPAEVFSCIPGNVDDYLNRLKTEAANYPSSIGTGQKPSESPSVDLLLRTALIKKVPDDLRSKLTIEILLQRIADMKLFNSQEVKDIDLGPITVEGDRASAEIYYQGTPTAIRLPFVREGKNWKIDILSALPYAEVLLRLDRTMTGKTEGQQVELLVRGLPSL